MNERAFPGTRIVAAGATKPAARIEADLAILGAGMAGVAAALEAAVLGRKVVLIDGAQQLGGQSTGSLIGTFCGFYGNGPQPYRVVYGAASRMLEDLRKAGATQPRHGRNTLILMYREQALARWIEDAVLEAGIRPLLGATLLGVQRRGNRIESLDIATRFGALSVQAKGYVDASGDAALSYAAGFACREPDSPIMGSLMFGIEGIDEAAALALDRWQVQARLAEVGPRYGLVRRDGFVFAIQGQGEYGGQALVNMTHVQTPLDAEGQALAQIEGRQQADRVLDFLKGEYGAVFGRARVRHYGLLGIRQTRWIVGRESLTVQQVREGHRHADAILRCSWPIELHDRLDDAHWEVFGDDHMHTLPYGAMLPAEAENLLAAGRCVDGDAAALSSVRVMGPCFAMGMAAAHAFDLAMERSGNGSVSQIDIAALQARLADNLERCDPA